MKTAARRRSCHATLLGLGLLAGSAIAGPMYDLPIYSNVIDYNNPTSVDRFGCASYGDVVSCSSSLLNLLHGLPNQTDIPTGYAIPTPQGELAKGYIVIGAGSNAALGNSETNPAPVGKVEDGYKANTGNLNYFMTGDGNFDDPDGDPAGGTAKSWDINLRYLLEALSIGGVRRDLLIGFDFNQPQSPEATSLDVWSLITVRDAVADGAGGTPKAALNYELNSSTIGYGSFNTAYGFDGANVTVPKSTDFVRVVAADCVLYSGGAIADIKPIYSGTCASNGYSGYEEYATSKATNSTEFINFLPELNNSLEGLLAQGYDTISVQLRMGCFGPRYDSKGDLITGDGPSLLDGLPTTACDAGGYGDVFLMAGAPTNVPEPGTLSLAAFGLIGLGFLGMRRRTLALRVG